MQHKVQHYINGNFIDLGETLIEVVNPMSELVIGHQPDGCEETVDAAVSAAQRAFDSGPWPHWSAAERAACLHLVADLIEENADLLAEIETQDNGNPIFLTRNGHLPRAVAHMRYFAEEASRLSGELFPLDNAYLSLVERVPLGVIAVISPWNGPLAVSTLNIAAALCAGNTCVLKPSEKAPLSSYFLSQLFDRSGFPPGVVNVIYGRGENAGSFLVRHPITKGVCFVGATDVGQEIMALSAPSLKKLTLELGGKSPTVVLADTDLEKALDGALLSAFSGNGEVCTAGSRIYVDASIFDKFLDRFVKRTRNIRIGDPLNHDTELGPLIDLSHRDRVLGIVEEAGGSGAQIVCGGKIPPNLSSGFFVEPTVLTHVTSEMEIMRTEVFGPVVVVQSFREIENAIAAANDTCFGLAASIWTQDTSKAIDIGRQIQAGVVGINTNPIRDFRAPFGGMKLSGLGRLGGRWSIEQFTNTRTLTIPVAGYELPRFGISDMSPAM